MNTTSEVRIEAPAEASKERLRIATTMAKLDPRCVCAGCCFLRALSDIDERRGTR